ncbi:MAG: DUF434 domain-containing protein [bacterium]|nr:DUF434 domain-containing protein [bacterium]
MSGNNLLNDSFAHAVCDYLYLLNKSYPPKNTIKLIGDRYRLSKIQRAALYRGISPEEKAARRRVKISRALNGKKLLVDGYNVLLTIMNYLLGKAVFLGNDGLVRDVGENYGNVESEECFSQAVDLTLAFLRSSCVECVEVFLDSPVTGSSGHEKKIKKKMNEVGIPGAVFLVKYADKALIENADGLLCTSDSGIIDKGKHNNVADLARLVLESELGATIVKIKR